MRTVHGHRISSRSREDFRTRRRRRLLWGAGALVTILLSALLVRRGMAARDLPPVSLRVDAPFVFGGRTVTGARVKDMLAARMGFTSRGGVMRCAYVPVGQEPESAATPAPGDTVRLFVEALCLEYVRDGDSLALGSGYAPPAALTGWVDGDSVRLTRVEVPADGPMDAGNIRRIFPHRVAQYLLRPTRSALGPRRAMRHVLRREAAARLGVSLGDADTAP